LSNHDSICTHIFHCRSQHLQAAHTLLYQ
jgi:hypothetical protein